MSLFSLFYHSMARPGAGLFDTPTDTRRLLIEFRRRNSEKQITSALMHYENRYAQILEGDEEQVRNLFAQIQRDVRHFDFTLVSCGDVEVRRFEGYAMAFVGFSLAARSYYHSYIYGRIGWNAWTSDELAMVMLKLISLDASDPVLGFQTEKLSVPVEAQSEL